MLKIPNKIPEKGFYYHYKHDATLSVNNYAYEVLGAGLHSEGNHEEINSKDMLVVYRPLYEEAFVFKMGKLFDLRPLEMFTEEVTKEGKTFLRFKKITDPDIIAQLEKIKGDMY